MYRQHTSINIGWYAYVSPSIYVHIYHIWHNLTSMEHICLHIIFPYRQDGAREDFPVCIPSWNPLLAPTKSEPLVPWTMAELSTKYQIWDLSTDFETCLVAFRVFPHVNWGSKDRGRRVPYRLWSSLWISAVRIKLTWQKCLQDIKQEEAAANIA